MQVMHKKHACNKTRKTTEQKLRVFEKLKKIKKEKKIAKQRKQNKSIKNRRQRQEHKEEAENINKQRILFAINFTQKKYAVVLLGFGGKQDRADLSLQLDGVDG